MLVIKSKNPRKPFKTLVVVEEGFLGAPDIEVAKVQSSWMGYSTVLHGNKYEADTIPALERKINR